MKEFFEKNKTFIAIIIAALIIGGFIYLANKPTTTPTPTIEKEIAEIQPPETPPSSECINYTEAGKHIGEHRCVTGKVDHVYTSSKGNNFLNFCPNYKTCPFFAVIFSSDAYKFSNIKGYGGKTVEIAGLIKAYEGRPEIIINDPSQIKIK